MNALDWICAALLAASLLLGAWRGLLYEVVALAGWVLAFVLASGSAGAVGQWLPMGDSPEPLRHAAGFVLVFIGVAFAGGLLASLVRRAARALGVRPIDRVLGLAFGALRGVTLLLVLVFAAGFTQLPQQSSWQQSLSVMWLRAVLGKLEPYLPTDRLPSPPHLPQLPPASSPATPPATPSSAPSSAPLAGATA
ncbi:MAG: CvpA family protein [Pseudomonadota bacterium]|nr:CvpA family protein [Pseudomonadota bacterium]